MKKMLQMPSVWVPLLMSLVALCLVLGYAWLFGVQEPRVQPDEGATARMFQLLIAGQVPFGGYLILRWGSKKPKQTLQIIVLQLLAVCVALAPVWWWEW